MGFISANITYNGDTNKYYVEIISSYLYFFSQSSFKCFDSLAGAKQYLLDTRCYNSFSLGPNVELADEIKNNAFTGVVVDAITVVKPTSDEKLEELKNVEWPKLNRSKRA